MKISDFKKRQETASRDLEKLSADLAGLKDQRAALAVDITSAIDADDFARVEKLTAQQSALENRIKAAEMIIARKQETSAVNPAEVAAASNAEMMDYQKKIDKAQAAADDILRDYFRKVLEIAALVEQSWKTRADYLRLLPGIEDPTTDNIQTKGFNGVSHKVRKVDRNAEIDAILTDINPDALRLLSELTKNRFNRWAGQNEPAREIRLG